MVFQRIIFSALLVGLIAGLLMSAVQSVGTTPIILAAEAFEQADHDHGSHDHDAEAWGPEDGAERTFYTVLSSIFAGIGFSAVLLSIMSQLQVMGITQLNPMKGALWGVAGFLAIFVAPGIGLPPEIPGIEAAPVENRQLWWLFTVVSTAVGLGILAFTPLKVKALGLVCIVLPYLAGAPHIDGPEFAHPDPAVVAKLTELHGQFIWASGATNLVFWVVMGIASAWVLNRWVLKGVVSDAEHNVQQA